MNPIAPFDLSKLEHSSLTRFAGANITVGGLISAAVILLAAFALSWIVTRALRRVRERADRGRQAVYLLERLTGYSIIVFGVISALSAHTAEGGLYEVDMRLRPTGSKGPVSVRLSAFDDYYAREAETWEFMVLTRARVVWASDPAFGARVSAARSAIA